MERLTTNIVRRLFLVALTILSHGLTALGQTHVCKNGNVKFFSKAPLEDIEAVTSQATCAFNSKTHEVAVLIGIKSFRFDKSLMEEHFNQTYMESDQYPEATFSGILKDDFTDNQPEGKRAVTLSGQLKIHGVTKNVELKAMVKEAGGYLMATGQFKLKLNDYKIKIPRLLFKNIAEVVDVSFDFTLKQI